MKRSVFVLICIVLIFGCTKEQSVGEVINSTINTVLEPTKPTLPFTFEKTGDYTALKTQIVKDKQFFRRLYEQNKQKAIDSASVYLKTTLLDKIVPHWYGTVWDFNGHTNTPNDGLIACGYFVSTTLKHLGFKLNRYKMAQQAGLNEAKALQPKKDLKIYSNLSFEKLKSKLNEVYKDGVYFVGLDNHVGYVVIKNKEIYFLHSSYCDNKVVIELAKNAPCFQSNLYVFAEITTNRKLIEKWILSQSLVIPTQ